MYVALSIVMYIGVYIDICIDIHIYIQIYIVYIYIYVYVIYLSVKHRPQTNNHNTQTPTHTRAHTHYNTYHTYGTHILLTHTHTCNTYYKHPPIPFKAGQGIYLFTSGMDFVVRPLPATPEWICSSTSELQNCCFNAHIRHSSWRPAPSQPQTYDRGV